MYYYQCLRIVCFAQYREIESCVYIYKNGSRPLPSLLRSCVRARIEFPVFRADEPCELVEIHGPYTVPLKAYKSYPDPLHCATTVLRDRKTETSFSLANAHNVPVCLSRPMQWGGGGGKAENRSRDLVSKYVSRKQFSHGTPNTARKMADFN